MTILKFQSGMVENPVIGRNDEICINVIWRFKTVVIQKISVLLKEYFNLDHLELFKAKFIIGMIFALNLNTVLTA